MPGRDGAIVSSHRYSPRAMVADYLRAAFGAAVSLAPLTFFQVAPTMVYILGGLGAVFVLFGGRTVLRQLTCVELSADGLRLAGPIRGGLRWSELDDLALSYYSTRRDRTGGWMRLKLKGGGRTIKLDDTIDGFPEIALRAVTAARANGVALSGATVANLTALDIDVTATS